MHPIVAAGLLCGFMDMTAAMVVYGLVARLTPMRLWQGVAGGLIGPSTYEKGAATVILGLVCHYTVAFGAATAFYLVSRKIKLLTDYAVPVGVAYGVWVYFFMQYVVVPLSKQPHRPFSMKFTLIGIAIHIVCVGLPIALVTRYFTKSDLAIMQ
jgi:hypothetical protein